MKIMAVSRLIISGCILGISTVTFGYNNTAFAFGCSVPGTCVMASWQVGCDGFGRNGPRAAPKETWYSELQNDVSLGKTAVRCWCNNSITTHYPNDYIAPEDGGHGRFIKYISKEGENCTCKPGEESWVELDPSACSSGTEFATGFFYLAPPTPPVPSSSSSNGNRLMVPFLLGIGMMIMGE